MSDRVFIDTNVLVYCYSNDEPEKKEVALNLANSSNAILSTQVLTEFSNILKKRFGLTWEEIRLVIMETTKNFVIHINLPDTVLQACQIANRYGFSFYDSLILSSALEERCNIIYTEDMHDGQLINKTLTIVNPFMKITDLH